MASLLRVAKRKKDCRELAGEKQFDEFVMSSKGERSPARDRWHPSANWKLERETLHKIDPSPTYPPVTVQTEIGKTNFRYLFALEAKHYIPTHRFLHVTLKRIAFPTLKKKKVQSRRSSKQQQQTPSLTKGKDFRLVDRSCRDRCEGLWRANANKPSGDARAAYK